MTMFGLLIPLAKLNTILHSAKYLCENSSFTSTIYPYETDGAEIVADEIDEWTIGIKFCPGSFLFNVFA